MFTVETRIKLHQTDGAGILFFGNYFSIAHDLYESFMEQGGFDFNTVINNSDTIYLIVHAEADYKQSLPISENITVQMSAEKIGKSSYTLSYSILNHTDTVACELKTVHVAVDRLTQKKKNLPEKLRRHLESIAL